MTPFDNVYRSRRVFLTGHTGFKGSWLAAWLSRLGAEVTGFALPPATAPNHWDLLRLPVRDCRGDIRDKAELSAAMRESDPEIVFHLAAQPLVRRSYADPLESWSTNVMGTANLLEACRSLRSLKAIVIVTTDKVYLNTETSRGYREDDRLGGHDPYSASKAASELVVESYRQSFFSDPESPLISTVRAGNVIGGGDWSNDRLLPDIMRAVQQGKSLEVRSPQAVRAWQHVLDCSSGYLVLGKKMLLGQRELAQAWNFGPDTGDSSSVSKVLGEFQNLWPGFQWHHTSTSHPHETNLLLLDSSKARSLLDWRPVWSLECSLRKTAEWYRSFSERQQVLTDEQLHAYIAAAAESDCAWISQ
jgi:CDP-glucose 4,6-dehydratase